jgi:hypothetical protein
VSVQRTHEVYPGTDDVEFDPSVLGHARMVMDAMLVDGQVVPLLGAGVNLCGRTAGDAFIRGQLLPDGDELAAELAKKVPAYPREVLGDLLRVSQCVQGKRGWQVLYRTLHGLFDHDYPPTDLHTFLAEMPGRIAAMDQPPRDSHLLFVTTNFDDVLERALEQANEPFDLVWYVAQGAHMGRFMHQPPTGEAQVIEDPDRYVTPFDLTKRSVVLKIHGAIDRASADNDSFVITEDNYIEYLTRTDVRRLIPKPLVAKLRTSSILFLGYSMRDWNLRAIFHRIWHEERLGWTSWAIRRPLPDPRADAAGSAEDRELARYALLEAELEEGFWNDRGVDIFDVDLAEYTRALRRAAALVSEPVLR